MTDESTSFNPALALQRIVQEQIAEFSVAYDTAIDQAFRSGFAYLRMKDGRIVECGSALEVWEKPPQERTEELDG